jgi:hypothetical protein
VNVEAETGGLCAGGSDCWGTSSGTGVLRSTAPARELVKIQGAATGRKRPPEGDLLNNGSRSGDRDCRAGTGLAKPDEAHRREADAQHRPSRRLGNAGTSIVLFVEPHRQRPRPNCFPNRSWSLGLARRRQNRALIQPGPIDSDVSKGAARWANSLRASRVADRAQERGRGR